MDLNLATLIGQTEDDEKALLQRLLGTQRKLTAQGLANAARTTQTNTADIVAPTHRGIIVYLHVAAASGTGGLTLRIQGKDAFTGAYVTLATVSTAVTLVSVTSLIFGGGGGSSGASSPAIVGGILPDVFRIIVIPGDASSYTYAVSYILIP
jgi:hypothetical protein